MKSNVSIKTMLAVYIACLLVSCNGLTRPIPIPRPIPLPYPIPHPHPNPCFPGPILHQSAKFIQRPCLPIGKNGECSPCTFSSQCLQGKCWGSPLKCTDGSDASLRRCFLAECSPCKSSLECASKKCLSGKCVYDTQASRDKCFKKPECSSCSSSSECAQGKCWGSPLKCTDGTDASLRRCFLPECATCSSSLQCASKHCSRSKCLYQTAASSAKCFVIDFPLPKPCRHGFPCEVHPY